MEKCIKLFSLLLFLSVLGLGVTSCNDDEGYSLDKYWEDIVTVNKIGENTYDFTMDDGTKLWVAAPAGLNLKPKYDRAIINYTILSDKEGIYDHYVRLNGFYDVLTKKPVYIAEGDKVKQDSIGHDPIKVHAIWDGGDYLNIYFGFNVSGSEAHMLNLVSDQENLSINDDVVKLEFRHNRKNVNIPDKYTTNGYVSFNLEPYKIEGRNKVTFEISWKDFGGKTESKTIEYKYDGMDASLNENMVTISEDMTNLNIY